jgi:hypothetical protein
MTGQIARGSHVSQDRPTEHLFFPPQPTVWNFNGCVARILDNENACC